MDVSQAVHARRARPSAYISLSERVGVPLSLLCPGVPHLLVAHMLTSRQKRRMERVTGFLRRAAVTFVFSKPQERFLREVLGLEPDRARFVWDKVDHRFYTRRHPRSGAATFLA